MARLVTWLLVFVSLSAHAGESAPAAIRDLGVESPQTASAPSASSGLDALKKLLGGSDAADDLLPPDAAFQVAIHPRDAHTLVADLTPAKDYYLYRDRIKFRVQNPPSIAIVNVELPRGELKDDPGFGQVEIFRRPVQAIIALQRHKLDADRLTLRATFQGCNEPRGVCYPPIEKTLQVALPVAPAGGASASVGTAPAGKPSENGAVANKSYSADQGESGRIADWFRQKNFWFLLPAFFGLGLLLAFTPCMLPMIPILSGIIVGHGNRLTRSRGLGLSVSYVLGMAITYALAGIAAGLTGTLLAAYLQNPWMLGSVAVILVLLALSMFGVYELQFPASLQGRLAAASNKMPGGKAVGVFAMGVVSALIIGPCVAAPLAGALVYIGQTGDVLSGGAALFFMALGMGVPLLAVGASAGTLLPKAGRWMDSVKRFFGVVLLALAIYLISPVIPVLAQMLLWAALLIVCAIFLHAIDSLPNGASGYARLGKGAGVIALVMGVALLIGAFAGSRDILQPLAGPRTGEAKAGAATDLPFQRVNNLADLDARLQAARGRYVMLDFWAEWCVSCKEMDRFTFSDLRVKARLNEFVLLRADVTGNGPNDEALLRRFGLFGPPGIIFFDREGREIGFRVIGSQPPETFLASLDRVVHP
jgi:thiol:disulfide interchange protein DsbD